MPFFLVWIFSVSISGVLSAQTFSTGAVKTLDLNQCYEQALVRSESLEIQKERIRQVEERAKAVLGNVYPHLNFSHSEFFQDTSGVDAGGSGVGGTFTRSQRPESKLVLRQPIFSGFKEFAAARSFQASKKGENFLLQRARRALFLDLANSFYLVLQLEKDLENQKEILHLTQERIKELGGQVRLGKSRKSEVLNAESQRDLLRAQAETTRGQVAVAREVLSFWVGVDMGEVVLQDKLPLLEKIDPLGGALTQAEGRSDVLALRQEVESQRQRLKVARGSFWPTIGLLANYYAKRVGFQEPIDWDLLLSFDLPLFQGGSNIAQVREQGSELRQAELRLARGLREARSEIKKNYKTLESSLAQSKVLEEAYKKSQESYQLEVEEYRHGLVNNLEVLQVLDALHETKLSLDRARLQSKLNLIQLKVSLEEMPQ